MLRLVLMLRKPLMSEMVDDMSEEGCAIDESPLYQKYDAM